MTIDSEFKQNKDWKAFYEKLQKEFQDLRREHIEAVTSLKVLEDENEELRKELDALKGKKNVSP